MEYLMYGKYLFKAKRLEDCNWKIGYLVKNQEWAYIVKPLENREVEFETVDPNTICQCTGLKDRNGKLIWENDIVKAKYEDGFEEITEVAYSKNGYSPYLNEYECEGCCCYCKVTEVEVIGNIFDNPELLESEG